MCILVELDSEVGTCVGGSNAGASCSSPTDCLGGGLCAPTVFAQKSAWQNMNFGYASKTAFNAEVDPQGWKRPPEGQSDQRIELLVTRQIDQLPREDVLKWLGATADLEATRAPVVGTRRLAFGEGGWAAMKRLSHFPAELGAKFKQYRALLEKPTARVSQLTYLVHGCRRSGDYLTIHGNAYELCERIGSYGHIARHAALGEVKWNVTLEGPEPRRDGDGERFQLRMPVDAPFMLNHVLTATDEDTWGRGWLKPWHVALAIAILVLLGVAVYLQRRRNP